MKYDSLVLIPKTQRYIKKNGKLYKKDGFLWNKDKWSSDIVNNQVLLDLTYDYDGCMIGITKSGLLKQTEPGFLSSFVPYTMKHKVTMKEPISFDEMIKARCGFYPRFYELIDIFQKNTNVGSQVIFGSDGLSNNFNITFESAPKWLSVNPEQGTLYDNESQSITITCSSDDNDGTLYAYMNVASNGGSVSIPVTMNVNGSTLGDTNDDDNINNDDDDDE